MLRKSIIYLYIGVFFLSCLSSSDYIGYFGYSADAYKQEDTFHSLRAKATNNSPVTKIFETYLMTGLKEAGASSKTSSSGTEEQMRLNLNAQRSPLYDTWKALRYKSHKGNFFFTLDTDKYFEFLSFADGLGDDISEQAFIYYHLWVRGMRLEIATNPEDRDKAADLKEKADLCYEKMFDEIFKAVPERDSNRFMAMFDSRNSAAYLGDLFDEELKLELILRYSEKVGLLHDTLISLIKAIIKLPDSDKSERNERYESMVSNVIERISDGESLNSVSERMIDIEKQNRARHVERSTMPIHAFLKWVGRSIYGEVEHRASAVSEINHENSIIAMVNQAA